MEPHSSEHETPTDDACTLDTEPNPPIGPSLLAAALGIGIAGDMLLRTTPWGINIALWLCCLLGLTQLLFSCEKRSWNSGGYPWFLGASIFFALAFAWRDSGTLRIMNGAGLSISLAAMALYSSNGLYRLGWMAYALGMLRTLVMTALGGISLVTKDIQWRTLPKLAPSPVTAAGRGLLIALPLVFIFGAFFARADAVFYKIVHDFGSWTYQNMWPHLFFTALFTWLASGWLQEVLCATSRPISDPDIKTPMTFGMVEMTIVLGTLNALFLIFVVIQLRYLFGGEEMIFATTGLTYAEYARKGFFELVSVSTLALPLLLFAHWLLPADQPGQERVYRILALVLIALLFVIMLSAMQRMRLYQLTYGLTELRFYATAFMGWLAVVFVWFILTVLRGRRPYFIFGSLMIGFFTIAILNSMNPDGIIVRTNMTHLKTKFDTGYATSLSADAVPALVAYLSGLCAEDKEQMAIDDATANVHRLCEIERRQIARALLNRWTPFLRVDWRTWNWSRRRARQRIAAQVVGMQNKP